MQRSGVRSTQAALFFFSSVVHKSYILFLGRCAFCDPFVVWRAGRCSFLLGLARHTESLGGLGRPDFSHEEAALSPNLLTN